MNPEDSMPNAASETAEQTAAVEKQMGAEQAAAEAATPEPEVDNSILAETPIQPVVINEPKSLSEVAAGPAQADPTVLKTVESPLVEDTKPAEKLKTKNKTPIFIAIALIVLVLVGLGVWALASFLGKDNGGATADPERTAFFLENQKGDGTFALFDDTGAKLTDFIYSDKYSFNDAGYAIVRENNKGVAILANNGKLSVPYDKYTDITPAGVFYVAVDGSGEKTLIKGSGEKVEDVTDCYTVNGLVVAVFDSETTLYTIKGERLGELNKNDNPRDKKASSGVIAINADDHLYIIDTSTGDIKLKLEQKEAYDIYSANRALTTFSLKNTRTGKYDMTIINGKFVKWDTSNKHLPFVYSDGDFVYYDEYGTDNRWIMGSDGKKIQANHIRGRIVYFDSEHYAYITYDSKTLHVFVEGKETTVDNVYKVEARDGKYLVVYDSAPPQIYDKNFKFSRKFPKNSYSIYGPDQNGNYLLDKSAIVNEKNEIIELPKDVGYPTITLLDSGDYLIENYKKQMGIIDAEGKEKLEFGKYSEIKFENGAITAKNNDGKFVLFNKDYGIALNDRDTINVKDGYVEATKDDKLEYYTYSGQLIYEG